jgi:hypothetical protein
VTFSGLDGFFRRCEEGNSKRITNQKLLERCNSPHLPASGRGLAGFGNDVGKVLLIGFVVALLVFLAAAAPASGVTAQIHG